jgi:hypothetical protein
MLLLCLRNKYPQLFILLCHGKYVYVVYTTCFLVHKNYRQVEVKPPL